MAPSTIFYLACFLIVAAAASPKMFGFQTDLPNSVLLSCMTLLSRRNPLLAIAFAALGFVFVKIWRLLFSPLDLVRPLHEVGYVPGTKQSTRDVANDVRKRKTCGDVPPVFPNGWFRVLDSRQLGVGDVKHVYMLGERLAVFRGEDGVAYIVDAYCPHLGANLGIGGQVVGNRIQCPFHGWEFRGEDGKCVNIPYTDKVPDIAKTKAWPCLERNGTIMVWFHAEKAEPTWLPEEIEEITNGTWTYRGRSEHSINAHIEEIPENGADINHLNHLHYSPVMSGRDLRFIFTSWWASFFKHKWIGGWKALDGNEKHCGCLTVKHEAIVFGYRVPALDMFVQAKQIGPALVYLKFESKMGSGVFIHTVTPEEPLLQKMTHVIYCDSFMPTFMAKLMVYAEAIQVERDVMIWNNKKYLSKPLLAKEDHLISKHRRWYSQFFSENSPKLHFRKETSMEW